MRAVKIPRLEGSQYRAQNGKFGKLGLTYGHGTVFAPRKYLYQKEATGMERPEMYSVIRCNNPHLPVRAVKIPRLEGGSIGPRTESLHKLGRTYRHGTVFAPRKYLYQKEAKAYGETRNIFR